MTRSLLLVAGHALRWFSSNRPGPGFAFSPPYHGCMATLRERLGTAPDRFGSVDHAIGGSLGTVGFTALRVRDCGWNDASVEPLASNRPRLVRGADARDVLGVRDPAGGRLPPWQPA